MRISSQLSWITRSGLAPFPGCQGSFGIVPNGPAGSVVSFNIRQGLKCKYVDSTPTLTMWLLWSNCALLTTPKFLGVFPKTDTTQRKQRSLLDRRPSTEFSGKLRKFLRSLAEYLAALAFLCFHYVFDLYITCLTLSFNTVYMYLHSQNPWLGRRTPPDHPAPLTLSTFTFPPITFTPGIMSVILHIGHRIEEALRKQTCLKNEWRNSLHY